MNPKDIRQGILLSLALTLFLKCTLTVTGINLARYFNQIPLVTNQMDLAEMIPADKSTPWYSIAQPFYRFDAIWYEAVARTNYAGLPSGTAFFPLYPWIVNLLSGLFKSPFYITTFFLNTVLAFFTFFLFYMLVALEEKKETARKALLFFAFFPTSFFLFAPYAEPLLLSLFFLSLILMRKKYYFPSFAAGFLAAMTKPYGFLIAIPLMVASWGMKDKKEKINRIILACLVPIGTLLVLYFQNNMIGQKLAITGGISGWHMEFVNPVISILGSLKMFKWSPFDLPNDLNLLSVSGSVAFLIYFRNKPHRGYWWFSLALLLLFSSYQVAGGKLPLKSFGRYFLAFFPVFIALAGLKMNYILYIIYIASGMFLMTYFFIYYVFGFFVF